VRDAYRRYVGRRIVVQTAQHSVGGVLMSSSKRGLVLSDPALVDARPTPMDGAVFIPAASVGWVQVL